MQSILGADPAGRPSHCRASECFHPLEDADVPSATAGKDVSCDACYAATLAEKVANGSIRYGSMDETVSMEKVVSVIYDTEPRYPDV